MRRLVVGCLLALVASFSVVSVSTVPAHAERTPPVLKTLAKKMKCKWGEADTLSGGGDSQGWQCVVKNGKSRQDFFIMKYRNFPRALDYWRSYLAGTSISEPGYFARKGKILIVSQGNNGVDGDWGYSERWARYAANKVDGRVVSGYH